MRIEQGKEGKVTAWSHQMRDKKNIFRVKNAKHFFPDL